MENVYCLNHTVIPNFSGFHEEELILNPEPSLHSLSYPALRRGVTQLLGPWGEETELVGTIPLLLPFSGGVSDSREHTGDLSCSLEPPLQPGILNSSLCPLWVRVIALSRSSPFWLTSFTGLTFIRECPRGRRNTQVPAWALGSSSLPDRRARLWKFWRKPFLNRWRMLDCWGLGGDEGSLAWIWNSKPEIPNHL